MTLLVLRKYISEEPTGKHLQVSEQARAKQTKDQYLYESVIKSLVLVGTQYTYSVPLGRQVDELRLKVCRVFVRLFHHGLGSLVYRRDVRQTLAQFLLECLEDTNALESSR